MGFLRNEEEDASGLVPTKDDNEVIQKSRPKANVTFWLGRILGYRCNKVVKHLKMVAFRHITRAKYRPIYSDRWLQNHEYEIGTYFCNQTWMIISYKCLILHNDTLNFSMELCG